MNLGTVVTETSARMPDRVALRLGEATLTYRELDEASARVAALLRDRLVGAGDRVGVMLPNVPEFAAVYFGVLRAGGVVVPMNPLLKAREVAYHLSDSEARLAFVWHAAATEATQGAATVGAEVLDVDPAMFLAGLSDHAPARRMVERATHDTAVILYTSGTTGTPKGAELTHASLLRNAEVVQTDLVHLQPDDVVFGGLPLFHSFGQTCTLNVTMAAGATLALLPRFRRSRRGRCAQDHEGDRVRRGAHHVQRVAGAARTAGAAGPEGVHQRRCAAAPRGAAPVRGPVRLSGAGRLRPVRDLTGGLVHPH